MAAFYLDTSALVKRYAAEPGTAWVLTLTDPRARHDIYTVRVTGPEVVAALFRKARNGEIRRADAVRASGNFRRDWLTQFQLVEVDDRVTDLAMDLAERHGLRGYDSVQLAAAVQLHRTRLAMRLTTLTFVSADVGQLRAAGAEGLLTEDPDNRS